MPIYEYACNACGQRLEKLQKISADPLTDCPACQQPTLTRLVSAAGFRLAGGGWYETDFKSGNKKNLVGDAAQPVADSASQSTKESSSQSATGSSSKPAANSGRSAGESNSSA